MSKPRTDREAFQLVVKKINQTNLAACLGLTRQAVTRWGGIVPDRFVLQVSTITGIPADWLRPELVKETRRLARKVLGA